MKDNLQDIDIIDTVAVQSLCMLRLSFSEHTFNPTMPDLILVAKLNCAFAESGNKILGSVTQEEST